MLCLQCDTVDGWHLHTKLRLHPTMTHLIACTVQIACVNCRLKWVFIESIYVECICKALNYSCFDCAYKLRVYKCRLHLNMNALVTNSNRILSRCIASHHSLWLLFSCTIWQSIRKEQLTVWQFEMSKCWLKIMENWKCGSPCSFDLILKWMRSMGNQWIRVISRTCDVFSWSWTAITVMWLCYCDLTFHLIQMLKHTQTPHNTLFTELNA